MRRLLGRLRPGPGGRTIEEPGLVPEWLQVALAVVAMGVLAGALVYQVGPLIWG